MIIEKQNYDLIIGTIPPWRRKVSYIFDGWYDTQKQKEFHSSLSFFASEVYGSRVAPVSPISHSIMNIICWGSTVRKKSDSLKETTEPPIGTIFDLTYNHKTASIEEIEEFLKNSGGIIFHRAEPFEKPTKTLWQVLTGKSKI